MTWADKFFQETSYKDYLSLATMGLQGWSEATGLQASSMSTASQASMASAMDRINAERMLANVDTITAQHQQEINALNLKEVETLNAQKETMSASGFALDSESFTDIQNQTNYQVSKKVSELTLVYKNQLIENEYQSEMSKIQSALNRVKAESALKTAKVASWTGPLQGIAGITAAGALSYGKYTQGA